jgi:hypothetical protein
MDMQKKKKRDLYESSSEIDFQNLSSGSTPQTEDLVIKYS